MNEDYIKAKLESAGRTMMMLPARGTKPRGHVSGWPEIVRDFADMIEAPKQNTNPAPRATMQQMNELAEVEEWIVSLSVYCRQKQIPYVARVVGAASLRWPLSERPVFTWSKLARKMHTSPTSIKRWHDTGIGIICSQLANKSDEEGLNGSVVSFDQGK